MQKISVTKPVKIAITGKIGSGKSSLVRILLGLYIPDDGLVMVGGTNVNQIRPEDIRRNFGGLNDWVKKKNSNLNNIICYINISS